jgi:ABC-type glycerol-3-phosphate transport system substrate-binding protein
MTWAASFTDVVMPEGMDYLQFNAMTENGIYSFSGVTVPTGTENENEPSEKYESRILLVGFDGKATLIENYRPLSPEKDVTGKYDYSITASPQYLVPMKSGDLAVIETVWEGWVTRDGLNSDDEEYWMNYESNMECWYRLLNADGSEKFSRQIPLELDQYLSCAVQDREGNVVCLAGDTLLVLSPEGELIRKFGNGIYFERLVSLRSGVLFAVTWGEYGAELYPVDTQRGEFGSGRKLPKGAYNILAGGGAYPLYYSDGASFYGFDLESGKGEKLFSWLSTDVAPELYSDFAVPESGSVIGFVNDTQDGFVDTTQIYRLFEVKQVPASSVRQKKTLTLAVQWMGYDAGRAALNFNRSNEDYRIEIIDYSAYNTDYDYSAGLNKLLEDVMAGNMPDILALDDLPVDLLAAKGLLEDLYPYMDADPELSREDFFSNVLALREQNGKLISTIYGFSINTVIGSSAVVGDTPGWTYEEFNAALSSMQEGCRPMSAYTTRDDILYVCLGMNLDRFVNRATGKCNFENEEFTDMLKFASHFPETYNWDNYDWETDSDEKCLADGRQMLTMAWVNSTDDVLYNEYYFGGRPYTYIGYPTASGTGNFMTPSSAFAMSRSSSEKQAVWQFLRTFFTDEYQENQYTLPSSKAVFEAKLKNSMTEEYQKDANGEPIMDENGNPIRFVRSSYSDSMGNIYESYALSQAQADKLRELIETTTRTSTADENIQAIVTEQAGAYFRGEKSAEEVAGIVQKEVSSYINGQL